MMTMITMMTMMTMMAMMAMMAMMTMMTMMTMITMIPGEKKGAGRGGGRRAGRGRGQVGRRWLGGHQPQTRYNVYSEIRPGNMSAPLVPSQTQYQCVRVSMRCPSLVSECPSACWS